MRGYRLLAGAAALGIAVAAGPAAAEKVQLQFWHAMGGQLGDVLKQVVQKFNAAQDEYEIIETQKGNYPATLNAAIAAYRAGEPPHILQNNESGVLTMMLSDAIVPAHDLLEQHGVTVNLDDYLRPVVDTYTDPKGRLLAMPFNSSTPILFYNAEMLDKAGIKAPPATWQAMEEQIRAIRAAGAGECGYSFAAGPWQELENYSVYHDVPFATLANGFKGLGAELAINRTRVVDHIARLKRWTDEGLATFGAAAAATWASGARTNFLEGKCAFWIDSTAWHGTVEQGAKMKWGGALLPHEADVKPNSSMIGGAALYVFKGHEAAEYAGIAAFFRFLTDTDLQVFYHQATGYVPITTAAYEKAKADGYYKAHPSREYAVLQLLQGRPTDSSRTVRLGNFENVRVAIGEELEKLWAGQTDAQSALDRGVERGNELLRRFERQNQGKL